MKSSWVKAHCIVLACSLPFSLGHAAPPDCTCKDLPMMVKEIIEQEYLGKKFRDWSEYLPRGLDSPGRMQARAQSEFSAHFYPKGAGASAAGTQDGGHAALGTLYDSEQCGIGEFQYNKKGNPINQQGQEIAPLGEDGKPTGNRKPPKDNEQWLKQVSEDEYMNSGKQCKALTRYPWVHEQHHQQTCRQLKAEGRTNAWNSMEFFARNDAESYKAGADYLRQQTKELALRCGWEGSTGETAVPTPDRAKELAQQASRIARNRGGTKKAGNRGNGTAKIIMGVTIDASPMKDLLSRWTAECGDEEAPGCGALGASIEVGLVDLLRGLQRRGGADRQTLFDAAHAESPQLIPLAMSMMHNAETAEEVEFALHMTEHASPAVREAARRMLQGSNDPRWVQIVRWWKSPRQDGASALVPDLSPRPEAFGLSTFEGLRYRPFGNSDTQVLFTSAEAPNVVVKSVFKGKQIMTNASEMEKGAKDVEAAMMSMQQEMMQAAQTGDIKKINELTAKFMAMQQKMMPADPMAVNTEKGSIGILLEKDKASGVPTLVAHIRRDDESGQTLVIFERTSRP